MEKSTKKKKQTHLRIIMNQTEKRKIQKVPHNINSKFIFDLKTSPEKKAVLKITQVSQNKELKNQKHHFERKLME